MTAPFRPSVHEPAAFAWPPAAPWFEAFVLQPMRQRNTLLDAVFYDLGVLSDAERAMLVATTAVEGSILVVHPRAASGRQKAIVRHVDHAQLRAAPGRTLRRFAVAGVGSSDLGAAALARAVANHYGEPVGAIVAGYGMADAVAEAFSGWFHFGLENAVQEFTRRLQGEMAELMERIEMRKAVANRQRARAAAAEVVARPEAETLLELLLDPDRDIRSILGHSKGCLSIAHAMNGLADLKNAKRLKAAQEMQIVTIGAVVGFPPGFRSLVQFLGERDLLGLMNSRSGVPRFSTPMQVITLIPASWARWIWRSCWRQRRTWHSPQRFRRWPRPR